MIYPVHVSPPDQNCPAYRAHLGDETTVIFGIVGESQPNDTIVGAMRDLAQKLGDALDGGTYVACHVDAPAQPPAEPPLPAA
jgi:hypothetical protein